MTILFPPLADGEVVIRDKAYFANKPHTFLDFETRGDGTPVGLCCLEADLQAWDEYEQLGFVYDDRPVVWQNTPPPSFGGPISPVGGVGDAVVAVGSRPTAIGGSFDGWALHFLTPVHAFGVAVIRNGFEFDDPTRLPSIHVFSAENALIGVLELSGDMVQGNFGGLWAGGAFGELYNVEYGFMGMASSTPIARLEFEHASNTIFDDLHFSAVPAPGAGAALVIAGALALRRRR